MKNIILLFALFGITCLNAQYLELTPNGLMSGNDADKPYVVVNIEGKTANELYDNAVAYVQRNYRNPDFAIKGKIEDKFLSFDTHEPCLSLLQALGTKTIEVNYKTTMDFKDGKIRISFIDKDLYYYYDHKKYDISIQFMPISTGISSIYNRKGDIKGTMSALAYDIETYFNDKVGNMVDFISNSHDKVDSDDW